MSEFVQFALPGMPLRLSVSAVVMDPGSGLSCVTVVVDPPSDQYEVVWYQDTITDRFTLDELSTCISTMVHQALAALDRGHLDVRDDSGKMLFGRTVLPI